MGNTDYSVHFLRRLERAPADQAELALQLYHSPEDLRFVLDSVKIPERVERVAISLNTSDEGPYLVATRDGNFVTCLSEGMGIDDLHLVRHERLIALMTRHEELRKKWQMATEIVGPGKETKKLFKRLMTKGDGLTREEMYSLSATQAALKPYLLVQLAKAIGRFERRSEKLIKRKRWGKKDHEMLHQYYASFRAIGHLYLLTSMSGSKGLERLFFDRDDLIDVLLFPIFWGDASMIRRMLFFIGMLGKLTLKGCKQRVLAPESGDFWFFGLLGINVIAQRNKKLRTQCLKMIPKIANSLKEFDESILDFPRQHFPEGFMETYLQTLHVPEIVYDTWLETLKKTFWKQLEFAEEQPSRFGWKSHEDIPDDIALVWEAGFHESFRRKSSVTTEIAISLPWLGRCNALDFYYPHEFYEKIRTPWRPEKAIQLIDHEREFLKLEPEKASPKPGRNEPCSCGSGKKYKKCCMNKEI